MLKKLVRQGRVQGYRPSLSQFKDLLQLAQRDVGDQAKARIIYRNGDAEFYSRDDLNRVEDSDIDELLDVAPGAGELSNVEFFIAQDVPMRKVVIAVGPGNWTNYSVESDDRTWAFGRYHELSEKLTEDRGMYIKFKSSSPEVLKEGTDNKWEAAPWKPVRDWRVFMVAIILSAPYVAFFFFVGLWGLYEVNAHYPAGRTKADRATYVDALNATRWIDFHSQGLIRIFVVYLAGLWLLSRWVKTLRRSKILLRTNSISASLILSKNRTDRVGLLSLYVTVAILIVTVISVFAILK